MISALIAQFAPWIIAALATLAGVLGFRAKVRSDLKKELELKDKTNALEIDRKADVARNASARADRLSDDGFKRD